jgi:SOS response regulatory protein OraA/RecX
MNSEAYPALIAACRLLKRQDLTLQEISQRIEPKFSANAVKETLQFLTDKKFVDDIRLARLAFERNEGRRAIGDELLKHKLESRGVPSEVIAGLFEEADTDELNRARILVQAKFSGSNSPGRVARFLASRGFSEDTIESILEEIPQPETVESE